MTSLRPPLRRCALPALILSLLAACGEGGTGKEPNPSPTAVHNALKAHRHGHRHDWLAQNLGSPTTRVLGSKVQPGDTISPAECALVYKAPTPSPLILGKDPLLATQWHLYNDGSLPGTKAGEDLHLNGIWRWGRGEGVRVAVVDDGLDVIHEDLVENVVPGASHNYGPYNRGNDLPLPCRAGQTHGTAVGGLIAARDFNGTGLSGVAPRASLVGYNPLATGAAADVLDALTRDLKHNHIYNNSWGQSNWGHFQHANPSISAWQALLAQGLREGRNGRGAIYVFAAGNGGTFGDFSNYESGVSTMGTVGVCATNSLGKRASYSEPGSNLLVCAPSGDFPQQGQQTPAQLGAPSTGLQNTYSTDFSGTSAAAPMVSGVVALMLQANPRLTWRDVRLVLARSARKVDPDHKGWTHWRGLNYNHEYGFGVVDAEAAVTMARRWNSVGGSDQQKKCGPYRVELNQPIAQAAIPATGLGMNQAPEGGIQHAIPVPADCDIRHIEHTYVKMSVLDATKDEEAFDAGSLQMTLTAPSGQVATLALPHLCFESPEGGAYPKPTPCTGLGSFTFGVTRFLDQPARMQKNDQWTLSVVDRNTQPTARPARLRYWELTLYGR